MHLIDLPDDVLSLVFIQLSPKDFLSLCRSTKALYTQYRQDPLYWRTTTSTTFRTPISPLLRTDGVRWYNLYRRLRTQTRLYTWGQGLKGNLGHGVTGPRIRGPRGLRVRGNPVVSPRTVFQRVNSTWPTEAHIPDEVGVIADMQCGGWSTVVLSSSGRLYCTGSVNGTALDPDKHNDGFGRLEYLTQSHSAISQFSAGRSHILAMTDDGEIISWDRTNAKGLKIDLRAADKIAGKPSRVTAGWDESSVYIPSVGIMYWKPLKNDQEDEMLDARETQAVVIPVTSRQVKNDVIMSDVTAHILLEGYVVWITSTNQIWACGFDQIGDNTNESTSTPFQVPGYVEDNSTIEDVQGTFRNFAVFTSSGKVLSGNTDYLNLCSSAAQTEADSDPTTWSSIEQIVSAKPSPIPALQHSGVISVAFGDYHSHALHTNGSITSFGEESQSCGALGLGDAGYEGLYRGARVRMMDRNASLIVTASYRGRQVWFEPEKRMWLKWWREGVIELRRNGERLTPFASDDRMHAMFSEWIEQEGRHWEDGPSMQSPVSQQMKPIEKGLDENEQDTSHLSSYFALAISAAGWHSGALVLVDEDKAHEVRQKWISDKTDTHTDQPKNESSSSDRLVLDMPNPRPPTDSQPEDDEGKQDVPEPVPAWVKQGFSRLKLPDGGELYAVTEDSAGEQRSSDTFMTWRDGMPSLEELGFPPT